MCYNKDLLKSYHEVEDKKVLLGDSQKTLVLKDVLHTSEVRKNLVSGYLLNKVGFTQTFGADLYTLTKKTCL